MGAEDLVLPMSFGPYELRRLIAAGGMARVYEGRLSGPHGFVKRLAVKMMLPEHAGDADFVAMLIDEAKIAVRLSHSNICQILDLGLIDGRYYIAMEYVEGADLNMVVNKAIQMGVSIPFDVIAQIGQNICSGLNYAHTQVDDRGYPLKIIHRDVSPANILLSMSGEVKIVDFGVAKAASRSQHTQVGVVKGKYQYMSPEQVAGGGIDHRTDIFATGIVMYESIAGQMLYYDSPDLLERIRLGKFRPLDRVRRDTPPGLVAVLNKALSKRPGDRYQTADELGGALEEFALVYRAHHGTSRLTDLMDHLFGEEKRKLMAETADATELVARPLSKAEMIDRGGSLVWSPNHAEDAPFFEEDVDKTMDGSSPFDLDATPLASGLGLDDVPNDQTLEVTKENPEYDLPELEGESDFDVDVDLTFVDTPNSSQPRASLYLVRDPTGQTSGPFSRAQLHELVLSGSISDNDEVLPIDGAGAEWASLDERWMPATGHVPVSPAAAPQRSSHDQGAPSRTVDLSTVSPVRILLDLASERATAVAVFHRPGARKEVTFHDGCPIYASSNLPAELLGERLVRLGLLARTGLGQGLQHAGARGILLGQALVELGLVSSGTLDRSLEGLVRGRLLELFLWRAGHVALHFGSFGATPYEANIDPIELINEGVDHVAGTDGAVGWLLELEDKHLRLAGSLTTKLSIFGLGEMELQFLDQFSVPSRAQDALARVAQIDRNQVARTLMLALLLGHLSVVNR